MELRFCKISQSNQRFLTDMPHFSLHAILFVKDSISPKISLEKETQRSCLLLPWDSCFFISSQR